MPPELREEIFNNLKEHTKKGGLNALNAFVRKPFIEAPPEKEGYTTLFKSGELFGYYADWEFKRCDEIIFDCRSGGVPHKHCMDTVIAVKR